VGNKEVAEVVREKKIKYGNWKRENSTAAWKEYKKNIKNAKRVISSANEKKQKEYASYLMILNIFLTAKQAVKERQGTTGSNFLKKSFM